jgi:hypothetical protein
MTPVHGLRKARALGALTAITALDLAGALAGKVNSNTVLSYHQNVDGLRWAA